MPNDEIQIIYKPISVIKIDFVIKREIWRFLWNCWWCIVFTKNHLVTLAVGFTKN